MKREFKRIIPGEPPQPAQTQWRRIQVCPKCNNTGKILCEDKRELPVTQFYRPCPDCLWRDPHDPKRTIQDTWSEEHAGDNFDALGLCDDCQRTRAQGHHPSCAAAPLPCPDCLWRDPHDPKRTTWSEEHQDYDDFGLCDDMSPRLSRE